MSAAVLPSALKLGTVQLRVANLDRSLNYYQDMIGLRLLKREAGSAELGTADGSALLRLREMSRSPRMPRRPAAGLYHYALLLPDRESLGLVLRHLARNGIDVGQGDHLVSEALYIQDPDGNGIELYRDRPRSEWTYDPEGRVVMTADPVDVEGLVEASSGLVWNGLPDGTVMGHVHFHVGHLEQARQFYCEVLGFDLTARYGRSALFVAAGGYHHHIGLNVWAGEGATPANEDEAGIDFFTLLLPTKKDRDELISRVRKAGWPVEEGQDMLRDPWNIGIRLIAAG
ncbi:VOC family protein [Paenibacillus glufosinatiresistens]|uniref:VOC family protein n=1 Tax=Paenibacillus glufosinatiresistens TaxID=3070657 RepID=UPI00286E2B55|nr:VOC family protein [Paenibacillus sp. YX.27]